MCEVNYRNAMVLRGDQRSLARPVISTLTSSVACACYLIHSFPAAAADADTGRKNRELEEVVVTAQKYEQRLQEVPVPVTVVASDVLVSNSQLRVQDYYSKLPGVSFSTAAVPGDGNSPTIAFRGITTGGRSNATVGIVIDDLPYGATANPGFAPTVPDIDPGILERVEVLRGPQGTLYGASSMGGLLKFVTADPSTKNFGGRFQVGSSTVSGGGDGYSVRGNMNVPLTDDLAVRVSGFTVRDPGYVDNIRTGKRDMNKRDSDGGNLSAKWQPAEDLTVKLTAIVQDSLKRGDDTVYLDRGDELQYSTLPGTGTFGRRTEAYGLTLNGSVGELDLVSVTGYSVDQIRADGDYTEPAYGGFFSSLAQGYFGVSGVRVESRIKTEKFSQELRLSFPVGSRVDWLWGAFYTSEDLLLRNDFMAADATTGANVGRMIRFPSPSTYDEVAGFTNLTVRVTDRVDVQFGGRLSEISQNYRDQVSTGPWSTDLFGSDPFVSPGKGKTTDTAFTYLVTPRFKVSQDLMIYARLASGYRPGSPNALSGAVQGIPRDSDHDTTENYEIGVKGSLFGRTLSFDASIYRIDWKDLQLELVQPSTFFAYIDNAGEAKSQGVELSVDAQPVDGLKVSAWVAWNDSELSKPFPPEAGGTAAGSRLPFSSPWSGSLSVDQEFPIGNSITGSIGASATYVDNRAGFIAAQPQYLPSYIQTDLRASAQYETWGLNAYVNNIADKRGVLAGFPGLSTAGVYIQPRTIGVSLAKSF